MFGKLSIIGAAAAMGAATLVPTAPAQAQRYYDGYYSPRYERSYDRYDRADRYDRRYRGYDRRYYRNRRCDNGTGGTVIGAIAGGLLGHEIVGRRGDRTAGALIGGVAGALAGRAIDRSDNPRRCR